MTPARGKTGVAGFVACVALLVTPSAMAKGSFLDSDEYRNEKSTLGVLLTDADYGKLHKDMTHLDVELDWAWVPSQGDSRKLKSTGFQVNDHASIAVRTPVDHTGQNIEWLVGRTHEVLAINCKRLGWRLASEGELILETAIVDLLVSDGFDAVQFLNASNDHYVTLEVKLTEAESGKELFLARHRTHSANLVGAVWRGATQLTGFLANPILPRYLGLGKTVSLDMFDMPGEKKRHKLEKYSDPRAILIGQMKGSELFTEVVEDQAGAGYGLEVYVREANIVGAYQTTINVLADYVLKDRATGETVAEEQVATSATMTAAEIASGGKRLKSVVPAAFRNNVDTFLFRLASASDVTGRSR